jgi:hypothetical protein
MESSRSRRPVPGYVYSSCIDGGIDSQPGDAVCSPQFHVVNDELFQSIANPGTDDADPLWMRLYRTGREAYLDMEELEENLHLDLDLQRQDFLTDEELENGRRNSSIDDDANADPVEATAEAPNSEGAQQATPATPNPGGARAQVVVETVSEDDDEDDELRRSLPKQQVKSLVPSPPPS